MDLDYQLPKLPKIDLNDPQAEVKKILYQAVLDLEKADNQTDLTSDIERLKSDLAINFERIKFDLNQEQATYQAYLDVIKGQIDRSLQRADFVQKGAAAISSIYIAILGVSFKVGETTIGALPLRGLAPAIFLSLAIVFATFYLAYPAKCSKIELTAEAVNSPFKRINFFNQWILLRTEKNKYSLKVAIISLGFGVFFLPIAFVNILDLTVSLATLIALLVTFITPKLFS